MPAWGDTGRGGPGEISQVAARSLLICSCSRSAAEVIPGRYVMQQWWAGCSCRVGGGGDSSQLLLTEATEQLAGQALT